ncbi:MAG: triose-phosphate isomerase, partial [Chitinophagaceae bacterium]
VPFPYLIMSNEAVKDLDGYAISAQNCYQLSAGAYTGEVSVDMLSSINIPFCLVGHSERRHYFNETNQQLAEKVVLLLSKNITPIFCCGESLETREAGEQDDFVHNQLKESLFKLTEAEVSKLVIAYEPIWAIGTGKTASTQQAQDMHAHIRKILADKYGSDIADKISILYGGSVKAGNAKEIFSQPDVDGGLVGGASLVAKDFIEIIKGLDQ